MSSETQSGIQTRSGSRFWRGGRIAFRCFRIALLALLLFATGLILWCNYFGVPNALAALIKTELRRKNVALDFSRLKLQGLTRFVAQNLQFASGNTNTQPRMEAREAELLVDFAKLRGGELEISGLRIEQGRVLVPIGATNEPPRFLVISNIVADVQLLPGDVIRVTRASAEAFGAKAQGGGQLQNLSRYAHARTGKQPASWDNIRRQLREVADVLEWVRFSEPPSISVHLFGDARDPADLRGAITVAAKAAQTQWGSFESLNLSSSVYPSASNSAVAASFSLRADNVRSRWGEARELSVAAESLWTRTMDQLVTNSIALQVHGVRTSWGNAESLSGSLFSIPGDATNELHSALAAHASTLEAEGYTFGATDFNASLGHKLPFPSPASWFRQAVQGTPASAALAEIRGDWRLLSSEIKLRNGTFDSVLLSGSLSSTNPQPGTVRDFLHGLNVPWALSVSNVLSDQIAIGTIRAAGQWASPLFTLTGLDARLYGGGVAGTGSLDFAEQIGRGEFRGDFDYQKIARLLDRPVQKWLAQFSWQKPPYVAASVAFRFPSLTNRWQESQHEIVRTLGISGHLTGGATIVGIPLENAEGEFHFTNFVWKLPALLITRPEGVSRFAYTGNVTNGDFACQLELRIDPASLKSLVPEEGQVAFKIVQFSEPPLIAGEAQGNWERPEEIVFRGNFALSNLVARGKKVDDLSGQILYSNLVLEGWNFSGHLGTGFVRAPYIRMDIPAETLFVTNVTSTANPYDAMHIVGRQAYHAIDPYRFARPPAVTVNGYVPLVHVDKADLWFDVAGEEFSFWRFHLPYLTGTVHWRGLELWITNVNASFYNGSAKWEGYFLIHDTERDEDDNADYRFSSSAKDADLTLLVADLFGMTNQMQGRLTGALVITSANTENPQSWNGYGEATLRDGFLWSVPVFGVFTPMLDALLPGEAMSRVTSGSGHFAITNSVVHTRDLQVRTRAFRLNYKGSVDLEGGLDALVEAEIFRDAWVFGKAFSVVLWPVAKAFEARISGTANSPKTQLRYFPRFLFAPFKTLSELGKSASNPKPESQRKNPGAAGLGPGDPRPPSP